MENLIERIRRNTLEAKIEDIREDINRSLDRLENDRENLFLELISEQENYQLHIQDILSVRTLETWETFIREKSLESFTLFVHSFSIDYGILLART